MKAPPHLAPQTRKWFTSVVTTYHLEPHQTPAPVQLAGELGIDASKRGRPSRGTALPWRRAGGRIRP